jgi:hypothetical protein
MMKENQPAARLRNILSSRAALFSVAAFLLAFTQPACVLITEGIYTRSHYDNYICRATLVDTTNGERRMLVSNMLSGTAPGAAERSFFSYDWDGNGMQNEADARLDWRRYLRNDVVTSSSFTGRSWCIRPAETSCMQSGRISRPSGRLPPLPAAEVTDCSGAEGAALVVSATGLTMDNQFAFPDTLVGSTSAAVTFTVTNASSIGLRVNTVDFIAGADVPDFIKTADTCAPTPAEIGMGRGHLLGAGDACTLQLQFRPQHRDGIAECTSTAPNESCRRRASLLVTGEIDASRSMVTPVNVGVSGRALGGDITTEPAEVCFAAAPTLGSCTPYRNLRITNSSGGDLTLTSAMLTMPGNRFDATMPFLMSFTVPMGFSLNVPVRFCNVANDPTNGEFTINSSSPTRPTTVVTLVNPLNRTCP